MTDRIVTIEGYYPPSKESNMARRYRRRRHLSGARKCRYGVNKRTKACLKHPRKRRK